MKKQKEGKREKRWRVSLRDALDILKLIQLLEWLIELIREI